METLCVRYGSWLVFDEDYQPICKGDLINDILHFTPFVLHPVEIPNNSYNQITYSKYEFNGIVESVFEKDIHALLHHYYKGRFVVVKAGKLRFCIFWFFKFGDIPKIGDTLTGSGELNLASYIDTLDFFNKKNNPELFKYFFVRKIYKVNPSYEIVKIEVNVEEGSEFREYKEYLESSECISEQHISEVETMDNFDGRYYLMEVYFHIKKQIKSS